MSLAHFTLPTRELEKTARFFEATLGYARTPLPANSAPEAVWFNIGNGQQMHVLYVEGFETSANYWNVTGSGNVSAYLATYAAHDGTYGLDNGGNGDWNPANFGNHWSRDWGLGAGG